MLARIVNMRGVDLNRFDFDYDLTWVAFFMNANGKVYGRFGGRDAGPADAHLSLPGLKLAMHAALAAYRRDPDARPEGGAAMPRTVEDYPAAARLKSEQCIHCHQVYDFRREALRAAGQWSRDQIWVYPPPEKVGLTLEEGAGEERFGASGSEASGGRQTFALQPTRSVGHRRGPFPGMGARVRSVAADSPAGRAGLRAGDELRELNGLPVASYGDVQYALHRAPAAGEVSVRWQRDGRGKKGRLSLAQGWRESDISWRASMWGLSPAQAVWGPDLKPEEKKALGLGEKAMAFRQARPLTRQAREAGIKEQDIIVGIDDRRLEMTMAQFAAFVRLNYQAGDRVTLRVIRDGQRIDVPMVLRDRDGF